MLLRASLRSQQNKDYALNLATISILHESPNLVTDSRIHEQAELRSTLLHQQSK